MFMKVNELKKAQQTYRQHLDVSKYTEMEIEHGHDTDDRLHPRAHEREHVIVENILNKNKMNQVEFGSLRR